MMKKYDRFAETNIVYFILVFNAITKKFCFSLELTNNDIVLVHHYIDTELFLCLPHSLLIKIHV